LEPVWRNSANFIIAAALPGDLAAGTEQLWARHLDGNRYQVCCIPFFIYDVALGDLVETDSEHLVKRVLEKSGRLVFRVWFSPTQQSSADIVESLQHLGSLLEWSSRGLLAVDAANEDQGQRISSFLAEQERMGRLTYETGQS
jgi:hypothetical protein